MLQASRSSAASLTPHLGFPLALILGDWPAVPLPYPGAGFSSFPITPVRLRSQHSFRNQPRNQGYEDTSTQFLLPRDAHLGRETVL